MVRFGNRNNRLEPPVSKSRYASTPFDTPGNLYRGNSSNNNRRKKEVDATGDLDALIAQELQRYEELFQQSDRHYALPDDDTLQDGSIYTSMQASKNLSYSPPDNHLSNSNIISSTEDDTPILESTPSQAHHDDDALPPETLLKSEEEGEESAPACDVETAKAEVLESVVAPEPMLPVDQQLEEAVPAIAVNHGSNCNNSHDRKLQSKSIAESILADAAAPTPTPLAKSNKKRTSFPRLFFTGVYNVSSKTKSNASGPPVPSTPSSLPTPLTTASTKPSKIKFFTPSKKFFQPPSRTMSVSRLQGTHPRNLVLAAALAQPRNITKTEAAAPYMVTESTPPSPTSTMIQPPLCPPSPPPPMEHCIIHFGDGGSVISTHSSLTDALDAWIVHSGTPPRTIRGCLTNNVSPIRLEAYEGGLTPYNTAAYEDHATEDDCDDDASVASPGALLLTEEGLYFHNHHGKTADDLAAPDQPATVIQDNLVAMVWADKEQRALLKDNKASTHTDLIPEDADTQMVQALGMQQGNRPFDATINVKRNLFGSDHDVNCTGNHEDENQLDVSLAPLEFVLSAAKEEEEDHVAPVVREDTYTPEDEQVALALQYDEYNPECTPKPSKFKRFLSKLVNHPKMRQPQHEVPMPRLLEQERANALNAQLEQQRMEREETQRIQDMKQQELERQRKLELGSQDPPSHTSDTGNSTTEGSVCEHVVKARSLSLMKGEMMPHPHQDSHSSFTADITSAPSSSRPELEGPQTTTPTILAVPASPAYSSTLVNFQFNRQEGHRLFTMAYAVDISEQDGMKWKDVINRAWKEDRKLVKSGVFSAIALDRIYRIRDGRLEMRFELPYWGKHASQAFGPKTLKLILDVVGPQRPVQVTITLEEPHLAADVDDEEAMAALFSVGVNQTA